MNELDDPRSSAGKPPLSVDARLGFTVATGTLLVDSATTLAFLERIAGEPVTLTQMAHPRFWELLRDTFQWRAIDQWVKTGQ